MAKQSGIFFIRNEQGMTRIARTNDLKKRMNEWQAANLSPLRVIGKITTVSSRAMVTSYIRQRGDARTRTKTPTPCERDPSEATVLAELHRHFSSRRVHRDWHILDDAEFLELPLEHTRPVEELAGLVSRAETLWRAVDYVHAHSPGEFRGDDKWRSSRQGAMRSCLIAWLVEQGRHDLSVVLRFRKEFEFLECLVVRARQSYDIPGGVVMAQQYACWLMMYSPAIFEAFLCDPSMHSLTPKVDNWGNCADSALSELTAGTELEDKCVLRLFEDRIMGGARAEDFSGWDMGRAVAEFSG